MGQKQGRHNEAADARAKFRRRLPLFIRDRRRGSLRGWRRIARRRIDRPKWGEREHSKRIGSSEWGFSPFERSG